MYEFDFCHCCGQPMEQAEIYRGLTRKESLILYYIKKSESKGISRSDLSELVHKGRVVGRDSGGNNISVHIDRLREKIKDKGFDIPSARSYGIYKLVELKS